MVQWRHISTETFRVYSLEQTELVDLSLFDCHCRQHHYYYSRQHQVHIYLFTSLSTIFIVPKTCRVIPSTLTERFTIYAVMMDVLEIYLSWLYLYLITYMIPVQTYIKCSSQDHPFCIASYSALTASLVLEDLLYRYVSCH